MASSAGWEPCQRDKIQGPRAHARANSNIVSALSTLARMPVCVLWSTAAVHLRRGQLKQLEAVKPSDSFVTIYAGHHESAVKSALQRHFECVYRQDEFSLAENLEQDWLTT